MNLKKTIYVALGTTGFGTMFYSRINENMETEGRIIYFSLGAIIAGISIYMYHREPNNNKENNQRNTPKIEKIINGHIQTKRKD